MHAFIAVILERLRVVYFGYIQANQESAMLLAFNIIWGEKGEMITMYLPLAGLSTRRKKCGKRSCAL